MPDVRWAMVTPGGNAGSTIPTGCCMGLGRQCLETRGGGKGECSRMVAGRVQKRAFPQVERGEIDG
jgi:hypothetical protein